MTDNQQAKTPTTLIDLVDSIVHYDQSFHETSDPNFLELKRESINELASRLQMSKPGTALFAVILFNSIRGNFLSKAEASNILCSERSILVHDGFSELIRSGYVRCFRESLRRPDSRFYMPSDIEDQVAQNNIPTPKIRQQSKKKPAISVLPIQGFQDYTIQHEERTIGTIYFSLVDNYTYTAIIGNSIVANHDSLDVLIQMLNTLHHEKKLVI